MRDGWEESFITRGTVMELDKLVSYYSGRNIHQVYSTLIPCETNTRCATVEWPFLLFVFAFQLRGTFYEA